MGAAYWISALWVLALLMTHYVAYQMLLRPDLRICNPTSET